MHIVDSLIIGSFLLGIALFGLLTSKRNRNSADFFTAGGKLPWVAAMFSVVATETSVLTFVSVPGLAYRGEWFFLQIGLGYIVGRIAVSVLLLPAYFEHKTQSIYEIIGRRFGRRNQKLASGIFLLTRLLADAVRFVAVAGIVQLITGWSFVFSLIVIAGITVIYSLAGGIRAIVWVDAFQFLVYFAGGLLSILFLLHLLNLPISSIFEQLQDANKLAIFKTHSENFSKDAFYFVNALFGGAVLALASHGVDYMMVQRVLATSSLRDARKAMIGSGIFVAIQFAVFLFAGSLMWLWYSGNDLAKDREFPQFIQQAMPVGLKGLLLAGVLSAAMSTLSSSINALASSTVADWMKRRDIRSARLASVFWAILLILSSIAMKDNDGALVIVGLKIASFSYGALLSLFLLSKFKTSIANAAVLAGLLAGVASVFGMQSMGLAWTWYITISTIVNIVTVVTLNAIIQKD